jgi:beta-N-acetylhexosaminidase
MNVFQRQLRATAVALAIATALPASAQVAIPFPPLEGLIARPEGWTALPLPKPSIVATFARGCIPNSPELQWALLPTALRERPMREMIGQLLVISFSGRTPDAAGVAIARDALARSEVGGVLWFRHNVGTADDVRAINALFADAHPVLPAIVGIDQEGGAVTRIRPTEGAPVVPSAREVAAGSVAEAERIYREMAENLSSLGFTVNFGPVVDVEVNAQNPVIAEFGRAYGSDPATVIDYAEAFIEAHHAEGVATALKHFPGHGSSTADSHAGAIDLTPTWSRREMLPFTALMGARGTDMVMIGHLTLDGITGPDDLPASLSPLALNGFLRDTLCYEGLIVSDDLAMDAVSSRWGSAEAARLMVEAGGDVAIVSLPADRGMSLVAEIIDRLEAEAARSPAFAAKIRHAYARIVNHKLDMAEVRRLSDRSRITGETRVAAAN